MSSYLGQTRYGLYEDLVGWHRAGQSRFVRQRRGGQIRKTMNETHMKQAVALSRKSMELGHGGPFGAVIVRDGAIVGEG